MPVARELIDMTSSWIPHGAMLVARGLNNATTEQGLDWSILSQAAIYIGWTKEIGTASMSNLENQAYSAPERIHQCEHCFMRRLLFRETGHVNALDDCSDMVRTININYFFPSIVFYRACWVICAPSLSRKVQWIFFQTHEPFSMTHGILDFLLDAKSQVERMTLTTNNLRLGFGSYLSHRSCPPDSLFSLPCISTSSFPPFEFSLLMILRPFSRIVEHMRLVAIRSLDEILISSKAQMGGLRWKAALWLQPYEFWRLK